MHFPEINTPLQEVFHPLLVEKKLQLFIKRDDLIHSEISGNKFRKLKYNLLEAYSANKMQLVTFGGAYSNHIAATAAAGNLFDFKTVGVIRGNEFHGLNPTLKTAQENGMLLHYVSRTEYQQKSENFFLHKLKETYGDFHMIPEGGANVLATKGCAEIVEEIQIDFDYVVVPCGTGTTLGGIYTALSKNQKAVGISVLKGESTLLEEIQKIIPKALDSRIEVIGDYHFGGYAKMNVELLDFTNSFFEQTKIPLDLVYTAKMFYGIFDLASLDYFKPGQKIVAIHTGGLQGNIGMCKRYNAKLDFC